MILLIDNYDSFTYNLAQYLGELGADMRVLRNDAITLDEIARLQPSHIVISPGPGTPDEAGISIELIQRFHTSIPILGVCLGHQAICRAFGGKVVRAGQLMHGMVSSILHNGKGIFNGVPSPLIATRYHSLVAAEPLPDCLEVSARTSAGELMGLNHRQYPVVGVQFHPESILTEHGKLMLKNFLSFNSLTSQAAMQPNTPRGESVLMKEMITRIMAGEDLSEADAEITMNHIMEGKATPAQIGAFLMTLRMKGESVSEIAGCARAMRRNAVAVHPQRAQSLLDTCGTGGDGTGTINISTSAAFVVAGTGQAVAKHGNRSVSSRSGSADVLEALGVNLDLTPQQAADCIDECGIGFLFAQKLHPAMKHAGPTRRDLGMRTIFNILGPISNPAGAQYQLLGVYDPALTEILARVLGVLGSKAAYVVHGANGMDELSTCGPNRVSILKDGQVETITLDPQELGFRRSQPEELRGGDAQENAMALMDILSGRERGPKRDVVILNAAAALVASEKAANLKEGAQMAEESIAHGAALQAVKSLVQFTQACRPQAS